MKPPKRSSQTPTEVITLSEARLHLRLDTEGSPPSHPDDSIVSALIIAARENAESHTGLAIAESSYTLALDAFPIDAIELFLSPVQSITSVTYVDSGGATQTLTNTKYQLDNYSSPAKLFPLEPWPATKVKPNAVLINFIAGFTDGSPNNYPLPISLKQAMLIMIGTWYENRESIAEKETYERPMTATYLLTPHRVNLGV